MCWWFNVGVQIFLAISGFLYGRKNISNDIEFYRRKFKQILIPYYLTVLPFITIQFALFKESISIEKAVKVLLCNEMLEGGEHLWFVPTILICYGLTPFFQRVFDSNGNLLKTLILTLGGLFIAFEFFFPYFNAAWISCYLISFSVGYAEKHGKIFLEKLLSMTILALAVICNAIQIIITYIARIKLNGDSKVWFQLFCDYSHTLLGIALFSVLRYILLRILEKRELPIIVNFIVELSDKYSYEAYLVHQFFILGPMTMMQITNSTGVNILIILATTLLLAFFLKRNERCVFEIVNRKEIKV